MRRLVILSRMVRPQNSDILKMFFKNEHQWWVVSVTWEEMSSSSDQCDFNFFFLRNSRSLLADFEEFECRLEKKNVIMQHNFIQICSLVHPQQNLNDLWGRSGSLQQQQQQRRLNTQQRNNFHVLHSPFISRSESLLPSLMFITFWRARHGPHLAACSQLLRWSPRGATRDPWSIGTWPCERRRSPAWGSCWDFSAEITTDPRWRGHAWISSVGLSGIGPIILILSQKGRVYSQGSAVTGAGSCCCCISKSKESQGLGLVFCSADWLWDRFSELPPTCAICTNGRLWL